MNTTNSMAMIRVKREKPTRSSPPPRALTQSMVMTVMIAEPTPAQERPNVDRFSRSFPLWVKAGIMDQKGISIMV